MAKRECEVPAEHHYGKAIRVCCLSPGAAETILVCGYHSLDIKRSLELVREARRG